jgi:hypothetical protein
LCAPDDHFGQLLHPLFPHAHGDSHRPIFQDDARLAGTAAFDQAPGISAPPVAGSFLDAISGLLLPTLLAAMLLAASRRIVTAEARPEQRALAPPIPPPRQLLAVA